MKVAVLIALLRRANLDDEVVIPGGQGQLSDFFEVRAVRLASKMENARHVALLPLEGGWTLDSTPAPGIALGDGDGDGKGVPDGG